MDRDEERYAADPANPDTDGDTLLDGKEIRVYGTFPFSWDTDSDCLGDYREVKEDGTNPRLTALVPPSGSGAVEG